MDLGFFDVDMQPNFDDDPKDLVPELQEEIQEEILEALAIVLDLAWIKSGLEALGVTVHLTLDLKLLPAEAEATET